MSDVDKSSKKALLRHTADIVSALAARQDVAPQDIPHIISAVYEGLEAAAYGHSAPDVPRLEPAVPIEQSLTDDVIICLEDGLPFQSLKRHLRVKYDLTPEAYRKKWGLPADYPMVTPDYAKRRSELAKRAGLGKNK